MSDETSEFTRLSRAGIRRLAALYPDGGRGLLAGTLRTPEILGSALSLDEAQRRLREFLLDPVGGAIRAGDPGAEAWIDECLITRRLAPDNGSATIDLAAIVVGETLLAGEWLDDEVEGRRFAPRADEAIAAAIATLGPAVAARRVAELASHGGPEEDLLHFALLQAGRALACCAPATLSEPGMGGVVDRLLALLAAGSPEPLLDGVASALGPIAATPTREGERVRAAVLTALGGAMRAIEKPRAAPGGSFLAEIQELDRKRALPDEDFYRAAPQRNLADACAQILGRAAPRDAAGFAALRAVVLEERADPGALLPAFLQGLVDGAAIGPLAELCGQLLDGAEEERVLALGLAARVPLDACAPRLLAALADSSARIRRHAAAAVTLLEPAVAVPGLLARLEDSSAEVCAAAAAALVELGQAGRIRASFPPGPSNAVVGGARARAAAVSAAVSGPSNVVIGELVSAIAGGLGDGEGEATESPLVLALGRILRATPEGFARAAELCAELPEAVPIVALAMSATGEDAPAIAVPAAVRAPLDQALMPLIDGDGDEAELALSLLCHFSAGDRALLDRVATKLAHTEDAASLLTALADLRLRDPAAARAITPFLDDGEHLGARLAAAAVAGVALPAGDPGWQTVRALLPLGAVGSTTAYSALANLARAVSHAG